MCSIHVRRMPTRIFSNASSTIGAAIDTCSVLAIAIVTKLLWTKV